MKILVTQPKLQSDSSEELHMNEEPRCNPVLRYDLPKINGKRALRVSRHAMESSSCFADDSSPLLLLLLRRLRF